MTNRMGVEQGKVSLENTDIIEWQRLRNIVYERIKLAKWLPKIGLILKFEKEELRWISLPAYVYIGLIFLGLKTLAPWKLYWKVSYIVFTTCFAPNPSASSRTFELLNYFRVVKEHFSIKKVMINEHASSSDAHRRRIAICPCCLVLILRHREKDKKNCNCPFGMSFPQQQLLKKGPPCCVLIIMGFKMEAQLITGLGEKGLYRGKSDT